MEETNIQFFVKDRVPTITISGNVIGEAREHGRIVFMEHPDILNINKIQDLQNKIFLGFQNIVGITQQNIFHNINIHDNKVVFKKYDKDFSSNIVNNQHYLLNEPKQGTNLLKFSNIYKYFPDLDKQPNPSVILDLENYTDISILEHLLKELINPSFQSFDKTKIIYKITNFTEIAPLMLFSEAKQLHQNAIHILPSSKLHIENIKNLTDSMRMEIYYDIYYDAGYTCHKETGRWSKTDVLLKDGNTLDFTIVINDQFPTNIPIIPPKYCSPCPPKIIPHGLQHRHKIGQLASKKLGRISSMRFSRDHYMIKMREIEDFNINNICMRDIIDTTINVNIQSNSNSNSNAQNIHPLNRSIRCSQAPKNKF